jgi:YhcH/YjgK/YiaL family protein
MITGRIDCQAKTPKDIAKALEFIRRTDFSRLSLGKHNAPEFYFVIDEYETKDKKEKFAEQHRKYIDVHYIISGKESIGISHENPKNQVIDPYNEEKDRIKYGNVINEKFIELEPGNYVVFYPEEIHRPGCNVNNKKDIVRKMVIKIKCNP